MDINPSGYPSVLLLLRLSVYPSASPYICPPNLSLVHSSTPRRDGYLSACLPACPSRPLYDDCLPVRPITCPLARPSVHPFVCPYDRPPVYLPGQPSANITAHPITCSLASPSVRMTVHLSISPATRPPDTPSIRPFFEISCSSHQPLDFLP